MNRTVRIKLTDIIDTKSESIIINKIENLSRFRNNNITLQLWYDDGELSSKDIQNFISKYSVNTKIKIIIKPKLIDTSNNFIFFDMISCTAKPTKNHRLKFTYKTLNDIIEGIKELDKILEFITKEKPKKLQKRNDHED